jgi:hypothetical protein
LVARGGACAPRIEFELSDTSLDFSFQIVSTSFSMAVCCC